MADNSIIPVSDEQAKLGQELVKAISGAGGYVADIVGDLPKDLIGLLAGDRIKTMRAERAESLLKRARDKLMAQGVEEPRSPSLKFALPILAASVDESSEELQDIWSRLLAAAMSPDRSGHFRMAYRCG